MDFIWAYFKVLYNNIIEIEIRFDILGPNYLNKHVNVNE